MPKELLDPAPPKDCPEIREAVANAHELLEQIGPILDEWLPQVKAWWQDYQHARDACKNLSERAGHFSNVLKNPPLGLIVNEFLEILDQIGQKEKNLNQRLSQPEVDNLKAITSEAEQLYQKIIQAAERYDRATRALAELNQVLQDIEKLHQQAQELMEKSEHQEIYPIQWEESRPQWEKHSEQMETLGNRERRRTPNEVFKALDEGKTLRKETERLLKWIQYSVNKQAELINLLKHPLLEKAKENLTSVQPIIKAIRTFNDSVPTKACLKELEKKYEEICRKQEQVIPVDVSAPLPETILETRYDETLSLKNQHEGFKEKLNECLEELSKGINEQTGRIKGILDQLDEVAKIEDRAVKNARELVNNLGNSYSSNLRISDYKEVVERLKEVIEYWRKVTESANMLSGYYEELHPLHQEVQQMINRINDLYNEINEWELKHRPHRQSFDNLIEEWKQKSERYKRLQKESRYFDEVKSILTDLKSNFPDLIKKMEEALKKAKDDEQQVCKKEQEVKGLIEKWKNLKESLNEENYNKCENMLNQANSDLESIFQNYQNNWINYDSMFQKLDNIIQSLKEAQFTTKDGKQVSIKGE